MLYLVGDVSISDNMDSCLISMVINWCYWGLEIILYSCDSNGGCIDIGYMSKWRYWFNLALLLSYWFVLRYVLQYWLRRTIQSTVMVISCVIGLEIITVWIVCFGIRSKLLLYRVVLLILSKNSVVVIFVSWVCLLLAIQIFGKFQLLVTEYCVCS